MELAGQFFCALVIIVAFGYLMEAMVNLVGDLWQAYQALEDDHRKASERKARGG